MLITTQNEITSLMPTARWDRVDQLKGYLEEEERVALEPLLGTPLYLFICAEYERLKALYKDLTATTIKPTKKAKANPQVPYADITERLDMLHSRTMPSAQCGCHHQEEDDQTLNDRDMQTVRLIRICQQIEFYKMLSHKAGLLTVSFNEGGGMNLVSADGYDPADEKRMERVVRDAFMSAGRSTDSLLLFLEADAKGERLYTAMWEQADAYYLHKDLLFQTARILNEYLDIKSERMAFVSLVRDIRFCQRTYIRPRIGSKLLRAVVSYANRGLEDSGSSSSSSAVGDASPEEAYDELLSLLRSALAYYVESRRTTLGPKEEKLARRDSMTDAQQAMAMACDFIAENIDVLGEAAVGTPIYENIRKAEQQAEKDRKDSQSACDRLRRNAMEQKQRKLFTSFPAVHRGNDYKP